MFFAFPDLAALKQANDDWPGRVVSNDCANADGVGHGQLASTSV
jgi:hypothetical protein